MVILTNKSKYNLNLFIVPDIKTKSEDIIYNMYIITYIDQHYLKSLDTKSY